MLTRAILTGGILSILAGSIVYFGTEGADALETGVEKNLAVQETELAGGADLDLVEVTEADHPHKDEAKKTEKKPKKKWLDQYLKKSKDDTGSDANLKELEVAIEQPSEVAVEQDVTVESDQMQTETVSGIKLRPASKPKLSGEGDVEVEVDAHNDIAAEQAETVRVITRSVRDSSDADAKGAYIVSEESRVETIDVEGLDIDALNLDGEIDIEKLKEQLGIEGERNIQVRVIKKEMTGNPSRFNLQKDIKPAVDYDLILAEAKKLMVTDMRNQAVLEIVDYAIDNGDIVQAADLVDELSTPEIRDTARARIGTGLARNGKPDAAFAVLDALEIDELAAPIRLEIITALMATKAERQLQ